MKLAQVTDFAQGPKYVEAEAPPVPAPDSDLVQVTMLGAGLHRLVRSRAEGKHYSAKGLPHIPGVDGVGRTTDGKLVYFSAMTPKGGSFAEIINVPKAATIPVPEGVDPVQIAGLVNPGMSSWLAVKTRTENLPKDFKVLILGATTTSGALAVELVRTLGAGKIIGVARNLAKLQTLGLDDSIELKEPAEETDFSKAADVDLILDYLWGAPALQLLKSLPSFTKPIQFVQIGSMSGLDIPFPSDILRSKNITMRGSGPGSFTIPQMQQNLRSLITEALVHVKPQKFKVVSLKDIESAWSDEKDRLVFVP